MLYYLVFILVILASIFSTRTNAQPPANNDSTRTTQLFIDVHYLAEGKVNFEDVAKAHTKDLLVQNKYGVQFLKYWVDEKKGVVYCLSHASDSAAITETHREAHGLLPREVHAVTEGDAALVKEGKTFFLDIHKLGAGKVTAADVEKAHQKDLAVQEKHGVKFINYWVDEKKGLVYCLSQAKDAANVIQTHKEAHGLIPVTTIAVKQGR
jgi:hypothetical protein